MPHEIEGRLSLHRDGYGFVVPRRRVAGLAGDVFIPPSAVGTAMHGDTVLVRLEPRGERRGEARGPGRATGRILRIVNRANATLVGVFHAGPPATVQPLDDRLTEAVLIPRGAERVPAAETDHHRVLGEEARRGGAGQHQMPREGEIVEIELTEFPTATTQPRGRVREVLGDRDDFGVDVEIMIRKHHLPHHFPEEALEEAEALPAELPADELARRRDFRGQPIVTIDGETARDFDDAVRVTRLAGDRYELQVHIADVSWYVAPGSALDREARLRGTSVYFPDRAVPMLPARLSTDLCSLRPDVDRLTVSCVMEFGAGGDLENYWLGRGVIRSAARMTYTAVNAVLQQDPASRTQYGALAPQFEGMAALQTVLYERRQRRGSIDFDLPEPAIAFDEFGRMMSIVRSERNQAHRLIEEFMLAAAETVARHVQAAGVPGVYRIHEQPELKKVAEFEQIAAAFGYSLGTGPLPVKVMRERVGGRWHEYEVANEAAFRISPRNYQRLAARIAGTPEERILAYLMLRSLRQARYSADNVGHFALANDTYTHFTSPIRRYPDLIEHRILLSLLDAGLPPGPLKGVIGRKPRKAAAPAPARPGLDPELGDAAQLEAILRESSEAERRAEDAERELIDWKKVRYMERHLGDQFPALVLHATRAGLYVELTEMFIDGFIPAAALGEDRFRFREASREWVGERGGFRFRIGDRLRVHVDRIDPVRQEIHFSPVLDKGNARHH